MSDKKIKVAGYAKKVVYDGNIEYRNFSPDLVGVQLASNGGTPLFTMGNFSITTNLDPKTNKSFITNSFSNFTSLDDLQLTLDQTKALLTNNAGVILNLDKTNLKYYSLFGSLTEFVRVSLENVITTWPASLYMYSVNTNAAGTTITNNTFDNYTYDSISDTSSFRVNTNSIINSFDINYLLNGTIQDTFNASNDIRNLTVNFYSYAVLFEGVEFPVIGYTGSTDTVNDFIYFDIKGNPFSGQPNNITYHVKPNKTIEDTFFNTLDDFTSYLLNRLITPVYTATFSYPIKSEDGLILYVDKSVTWPVSDGYNIDFDSGEYLSYATELFEIATNNDLYTSNLMNRFLVSESITSFDTQPVFLADEHMDSSGQKMNKTLNLYGQEFDDINKFITGISFAHTVTYDKLDNTPDIYVKDLARVMGWDLISSVVENDLLANYVKASKSTYSGQTVGLTAVEADVELWRRLILNSPWIWKSKGARKTVEFLLKFIGTPQGLIQFNEYVYKADGPIDIDFFTQVLELNGLDTDLTLYSLDSNGYPRFQTDTDDMYFQNDGLWYRETGGADSVVDILTGNNPHVGPYDGGYKYINQLRTLIPNFSAVTITGETITSGTTNLFTNYLLGDITNYTGATYVDVINDDGSEINSTLVVVSSIIDDPRPTVEQTPCGCIPASADDALSICVKTVEPTIALPCSSLANQPTKDNENGYYVFQKYQYNQDGSIYSVNGNPVLTNGLFIDRECCTALNGAPSYSDYVNPTNSEVSSGYACCHGNNCGCSLACNWYLSPSTISISGNNFLDFRTLFGTGTHKVVSPDTSNCPTRWSTPVPNIIDPYTNETGFGCKINSLGVTEFTTMVNYFKAKADGGNGEVKCCAFTPEYYIDLITPPPVVVVPPVEPPVVIPPAGCKPILIFDYIGNGGPAIFKYKVCGDSNYSTHTFNLLPSTANPYTYPVYSDSAFTTKCIVENSMELVSGDITITQNRYIYSGTSCTSNPPVVVPPIVSRAWHFSNVGNTTVMDSCGNNTFTLTLYTSPQNGATPLMGSQMFTDANLTTLYTGGNLWYNSKEASAGTPTSYKINNAGVLIDSSTCPDYCCGDLIFYASNFTGENMSYAYQDCDTGTTIYVFIPYGGQPETAYGRIQCGQHQFGMSAYKSTGAEACAYVGAEIILYAATNALSIGTIVFEDASLQYPAIHGTTFMKEMATGKVWKIVNSKITAQYTC